jgi:hypothetical protein
MRGGRLTRGLVSEETTVPTPKAPKKEKTTVEKEVKPKPKKEKGAKVIKLTPSVKTTISKQSNPVETHGNNSESETKSESEGSSETEN